MKLIFDPEKLSPPPRSPFLLDNFLLNPGENEVDEAIKSHPDYKELLKIGAIKEIDGEILRDVTIQNYRCFEDFTINGLSRVNLIVGSNQIGKTSFLEAIYLLVNEPKDDSLLDILEQRGEFDDDSYLLNYIFHGYKPKNKEITISADTNLEEILLMKIKNSTLSYRRFRSPLLMSNEEISLWMNRWDVRLQQSKRDKSSLMLRELHPYIFISISRMSFDMMAKIWENIQLTAKEDKVVEALQIIEPKVQRIGFPSSKGQKMIRVRLQGENHPLPLSSMGEGMNRLLGLALGAVVAENGVLLVDEIDTGLHYEVQTDMWRLIIQTAQDLNIQVFATTHSWDCICALQEVLPDLEDDSVVKLFRLDAKYGKLRAVDYDAEGIDIVVQQSIEVR